MTPIHQWLTAPLPREVQQSVQRLSRCPDIHHIALMPDIHLAGEVCVGTVLATTRLLYPSAIGGDIGCGMAAIAFNASADLLSHKSSAEKLFQALYQHIPANRHHAPRDLPDSPLSHPTLKSIKRRDARVQLGTLGQGNHFLEFQSDEDNQLWLMLHTGSRGIGQAITNHHKAHATGRPIPALDATTSQGQSYLNDMHWAQQYAQANRQFIMYSVIQILHSLFQVTPIENSQIDCHHNFIRQENHNLHIREGEAPPEPFLPPQREAEAPPEPLLPNQRKYEPPTLKGTPPPHLYYIHRKGALSAAHNEPGLIPGSMASLSFHTQGQANPQSLKSSSHGAGRQLSRHQAKQKFTPQSLHQQMRNVWYDPAQSHHLVEESPQAYKNINTVMRAQKTLTKITRRLTPILNYKGRW